MMGDMGDYYRDMAEYHKARKKRTLGAFTQVAHLS